ncbi:MAG: sigma 54-interacting transcriptional regulator [Deltaproteobacteria bacterium]|nr:sigma 54-interacting transcriptional regulator [Deltaproteobacteria bacterium]
MASRRDADTEIDPEAGLGLPTRIETLRARLEVVEGASRGAVFTSASSRATIGSAPSNDVVLDDRTVSRFHCEIRLEPGGARLRDLDSRNGTLVDGVRANDVWLRDGSLLRVGRSVLSFRTSEDKARVRLSAACAFGGLVGRSVAMRAAFAVLERAAQSDSTLLVLGETGTGKEEAARAVHEASDRRDAPFVVVDCSALSASLVETELFGHVRGAFTGAHASRAGAFEAADGGTVFLDEIGELPTDLQPKLLRVLEQRTVQPVGVSRGRAVDVRVVAATNRNLRAEVNAGRFRADLYFRLAVVTVELPPLRERPEDLPLLVERLLESVRADEESRALLSSAESLDAMRRAAWPGNVRELRNHLERGVLLRQPLSLAGAGAERAPSSDGIAIDPRIGYAEARSAALADFERRYLDALLAHHGGNVSAAARGAGINRVYLHELLRRHGLR